MANVNKVILLGRLGKDPEVRYTQDGKAVATLSLATSETYKDHAGVKQERTEWHKVILWERKAEIAEQYLRKGDQAYIEGRLQTRKWTDNNNVERYSTEVVGDRMQLLGGQREGSRDSQPSAPQHNRNSSGAAVVAMVAGCRRWPLWKIFRTTRSRLGPTPTWMVHGADCWPVCGSER